MAENGETQEKRKGGIGKLFFIFGLLGAVVAFLTFWRRRGGDEEEEDFE
jgi:hypothetical protein